MVEQIFVGPNAEGSVIQPLETYQLSDGRCEMLFSVIYPEQYKAQLKGFLGAKPVLAIKTPLVDPDIRIERKRPLSFFTQLSKTNEFIDELGCDSVDLGCFDHHLTYDAVHWTQQGNKVVFDKIISKL